LLFWLEKSVNVMFHLEFIVVTGVAFGSTF
jgi:hypothetical protein